ncbi:MAG: HIT domain-containing protein [Atopobiaceae bacterium]|nr:HIT domain-containing protein [Atopobiaceae bacterium]
MSDTDCIFCKIAAGEMGELIYENERAAAFHDVSPQAAVHVLVVPKSHHDNICDGVDGDTLAAMVDAVQAVVEQTQIAQSGYRVITNTGADAGQAVAHLHWHVLGGQNLGPLVVPEH